MKLHTENSRIFRPWQIPTEGFGQESSAMLKSIVMSSIQRVESHVEEQLVEDSTYEMNTAYIPVPSKRISKVKANIKSIKIGKPASYKPDND